MEHHQIKIFAPVKNPLDVLASLANVRLMKSKNRWSSGSALFSSAHVEWGTPPDLKEALDKEFHFTLDPCKPDQIWDGREISWAGHRVFCNPPYGRKTGTWLAKGQEADLAVFLLPSRTDTAWFHDYALKADEIRFFRGRLQYCENHIKPAKWLNSAPFPSMLVIYRKCLIG